MHSAETRPEIEQIQLKIIIHKTQIVRLRVLRSQEAPTCACASMSFLHVLHTR